VTIAGVVAVVGMITMATTPPETHLAGTDPRPNFLMEVEAILLEETISILEMGPTPMETTILEETIPLFFLARRCHIH
jgi:hypothetical protein